jgi:hypothetical protein
MEGNFPSRSKENSFPPAYPNTGPAASGLRRTLERMARPYSSQGCLPWLNRTANR